MSEAPSIPETTAETRSLKVSPLVVSAVLCSLAMGVVAALALRARFSSGQSSSSHSAMAIEPGTRSNPVARDPTGLCGDADPTLPVKVRFDLDGKKSYDFGDVRQGVVMEDSIGFTNVGEGPLCIQSVRASCGCMKATLKSETRRYEPGDSGEILLVLKTKGKVGTLSKSVEMLTNDVKVPRKRFTASVNICKGVLTKPSFINFGRCPIGEPMTSTPLRVMSLHTEPDWAITKVVGLAPRHGDKAPEYTFTVKEKDDDEWRSRYVTIVRPAPTKKGALRGRARIHTTHPDQPTLDVDVSAYVMDRILIMNKRIALGYVRRGEPSRASPACRVYLNAASPRVKFKLLGAAVQPRKGDAVDPRGTGFAVKTGNSRRGPWAEVTYDGTPFDPGILEAELVLTTNDVVQSEIRLPVIATLRE